MHASTLYLARCHVFSVLAIIALFFTTTASGHTIKIISELEPIIAAEPCAVEAVEASASELVLVAMELGVDLPEELWVDRIDVLIAEVAFIIGFGEFLFEVELDDRCLALEVVWLE